MRSLIYTRKVKMQMSWRKMRFVRNRIMKSACDKYSFWTETFKVHKMHSITNYLCVSIFAANNLQLLSFSWTIILLVNPSYDHFICYRDFNPGPAGPCTGSVARNFITTEVISTHFFLHVSTVKKSHLTYNKGKQIIYNTLRAVRTNKHKLNWKYIVGNTKLFCWLN